MKRQRLISLLLILGLGLAPGCERRAENASESPAGAPAAAARPRYHFVMIIFGSAGNPFWLKVNKGAEEAGARLGCKVDIQYADSDPVKENDLIETCIANKVDGMGVVIYSDEAYDLSVKKAIDAGIPVICFNTDDTQGARGNARLAYIGQSIETAGTLIAERLVREAGLQRGDHVVCPVEHPEATYAQLRYAGARKVFDAAGITHELLNTGSVSLEETLTRLTQYLIGNKQTRAVLALGGMPLEMAPKAIAEAGLNIPNAGFDLTREIVRNILDGKTLATVDQQPFYQGFMTICQLYYNRQYGLLPCDINTGGAMIDKTNAAPALALAGDIR
ncbi:MAG: substrate-binding domain-containing protein [bacterium]|nr:substrate-binding domain-containing protein [bacterium]